MVRMSEEPAEETILPRGRYRTCRFEASLAQVPAILATLPWSRLE